MNIFVLDEDPIIAAQMHCDKHCVKMILETAQLLSTAVRLHGVDYGYLITHRNHPCSIWCRTNRENFEWLKQLGMGLCNEYTFRYNKVHKSEPIIVNMPSDCINNGARTSFVLAMPDEYKVLNNAVQSYQNYYRGAKKDILVYTHREPPEWIKDIAKYKGLK